MISTKMIKSNFSRWVIKGRKREKEEGGREGRKRKGRTAEGEKEKEEKRKE